MKDELGDRMKRNYENRTRIYLPRRTYTIVRVDGKCFSSYTKGCKRPFDAGLIADMDETAIYLCKNIQGAKFGFVQSDEISILVTDFDTLQTDAWFDGNIQKIVSVAASMATAKFNQLRWMRYVNERYNDAVAEDPISWEWFEGVRKLKLAEFDASTFTIPSKTEVANMMVWRQQDTVRNSISSVAQTLYSSKELRGKNMKVQQEMIFQKGQNWNDFTPQEKRGRFINKQEVQMESEFVDISKAQFSYTRTRWVVDECPIFTQDMDFLYNRIPEIP